MTSRLLNLKMRRDLAEGKWQYLAIAAMVLLGVAFFNAAYSAYLNLAGSYARSFKSLSFEDVSIQFSPAPRRVADRLRRIPGIKFVEGRLVEEVAVELPGRAQTRKLVGRLIGMPTNRQLSVNRLKIVDGSALTSGSRKECLIEASFARYHQLRPGQSIEAVWGAGQVRLRIAGIVQSAEYLYVVRSKHELMAMPDTFGVLFVPEETLGSLVGKPDLINEAHIALESPSHLAGVSQALNTVLKAYRPDEPVSRVDQPSYQMLMQDVQGFQAYAVLFPAFFLSVAAAAVYTLLLRMVHQQRPTIGLLLSLGFSRSAVVWHYLLGALSLGLAAALAGDLAGVWLAEWTSNAYLSMLQVPEPEIVPRPPVLAAGLLIGVLTCGVGALLPARMASRVRPADAMRPLTPAFGRRSVKLDRLLPNAPLLWRVPLRNLFRQPRRTLSTLFGIVAGIALIMTAKGLLDSSELAIDEMVSGSYRYDLRLDLVRPQSSAVVNRVQSWPGVVRAEGVLELPIEIGHAGKTYSALLSGQTAGAGLHQLRDSQGAPIAIPSTGAVFGSVLRKRLGLEIGDLVSMSVPSSITREAPRIRSVVVAGFNEEAMGTVAYMRREEVWRLFRTDLELPPNAVSGVVVRVRPTHLGSTRQRLLDLPEAGSVLSIPEIRSLIERMMDTFRIFVGIMEVFGVALALAMIFNMVTINVMERTAEIATLRTIGVSRRQIAWLVGAENLAVALIGIAAGLPFGRWFLAQFWLAAQTEEQQELFNFKVSVKLETYWLAAAAILAAVLLSQIPSLRALARLNLAKAAKERAS